MNRFLVRLVILGAPLALGLVEVWHFESLPFDSEGELGPFTRFRTLAPVADQWLIVHLLQAPLLALVGLAVYLMVRELGGAAAAVARFSMVVFVVFYTVFDAVDGIAVGVLVRNAIDLQAARLAAVEEAIDMLWNNPIVGNFSVVSVTGAAAWAVGVIAAAIALRMAGAPRPPVALMILSALIFGMSHASPMGPIGMACLLAAFVWLVFFPSASISLEAEAETAAVQRGAGVETGSEPAPEQPAAPARDRPAARHRRKRRRR